MSNLLKPIVKHAKIVIVCPKCNVVCYDIEMKELSDGNYWTVDTCWKCGKLLPKVRVESGD